MQIRQLLMLELQNTFALSHKELHSHSTGGEGAGRRKPALSRKKVPMGPFSSIRSPRENAGSSVLDSPKTLES